MSTTQASREGISVYFLAAPEDEDVCEAIREHLAPVIRSSEIPIEVESDFQIAGGAVIADQEQRLLQADIVLALISADFINDDRVYERNQRVIERHNNGQTVMIPILVRNCLWKLTPFGKQPLLPKLLPKSVQPLNNKQYWNSVDDALTAVVSDIYDSIGDVSAAFSTQRASAVPGAPPASGSSASSSAPGVDIGVDAASAPEPPIAAVIGPEPQAEAELESEPSPTASSMAQPSTSAGWEPPSSMPPPPAVVTVEQTVAHQPGTPVDVDWRRRYYRRVLWKRAAAVLLDMLFGCLAPFIAMVFVLIAIGADDSPSSDSTDTAISSIIIVAALAIYYIVSPLMEASSHKATFGKRMLRIEITDPHGRRISFWRAFVRNVLRTLVFYSYLLVVPLIVQIITFRKSKRLFHDQISKTVIGEKLTP